MKSIARFLMPALALALVSIFSSTITALAQDFPPPVGTVLPCRFRGNIAINRDGRDFVGTVEGSGTFQVIATTDNSATYIPIAIEARSTFGELGTFTTQLGAAAATQVSVANSLQADVPFPVRIEMRYPPIVTDPGDNPDSDEDDIVYTGGEVNFLIDASDSFNPIVNATSRIENPVTFTAEDGDTDPTNNPTFTLVRLNATFNN
jgi:hypothetical protein